MCRCCIRNLWRNSSFILRMKNERTRFLKNVLGKDFLCHKFWMLSNEWLYDYLDLGFIGSELSCLNFIMLHEEERLEVGHKRGNETKVHAQFNFLQLKAKFNSFSGMETHKSQKQTIFFSLIQPVFCLYMLNHANINNT